MCCKSTTAGMSALSGRGRGAGWGTWPCQLILLLRARSSSLSCSSMCFLQGNIALCALLAKHQDSGGGPTPQANEHGGEDVWSATCALGGCASAAPSRGDLPRLKLAPPSCAECAALWSWQGIKNGREAEEAPGAIRWTCLPHRRAPSSLSQDSGKRLWQSSGLASSIPHRFQRF